MDEPNPYITIDDFKKVEIRIGEILSVELIEGSDKLLKLKVNFGTEERQVLSGIKAYFEDPQTLVGKRCPFVTNLAPRMMMGLESQAMILAAGGGETPFALFETTGTPGDRIK
jgi:methionyl-tRNA synthetase